MLHAVIPVPEATAAPHLEAELEANEMETPYRVASVSCTFGLASCLAERSVWGACQPHASDRISLSNSAVRPQRSRSLAASDVA